MKKVLLLLIVTMVALPQWGWGQIVSFKFNNKFNHQVYVDAEGEIVDDTIRVSVGCIGKWLTPSFKLNEGDVAYVDGVAQRSKHSRLSFAEPVTYHVENTGSGYEHDYVVVVDFLTDHPTSQYRLPSVHITTADGKLPAHRHTYVDATFRIDGAGVFEDMDEQQMQIRGRGNTSWVGSEKKPYRLHFGTKQKPFGLTKGKNWVLLANSQQSSALCNPIAMEISCMVQSEVCNHIVPCELYINGEYRGCYNFTENPGFGNNSIALEDESRAALLELDAYYDEDFKFLDNWYYVYTNVKEPDFNEPDSTELTFEQLREHYNAFCRALKWGTDQEVAGLVDVVSVAKARFVTELTANTELMHPKSWRLYHADITDPDSLYKFGPVWDFDWSYGYEWSGMYFKNRAEDDLFDGMTSDNVGYPYFKKLFRGYDSIKREYYRLWVEWHEAGRTEELCDYVDCYYEYVSEALKHNRTKWKEDAADYETMCRRAKKWLRNRASYLLDTVEPYDLGGIEPVKPDHSLAGRELVDVYDLHGRCLRRGVRRDEVQLPKGIYIIRNRE